jgi:hypothetical protein
MPIMQLEKSRFVEGKALQLGPDTAGQAEQP